MQFLCPELPLEDINRKKPDLFSLSEYSSTNQKYTQMKALSMQKILVILAFSGLVLCALFAGCTSPTQAEIKPAETAVPTPPPTLPTSMVTVMPTPLPVETLPEEQSVDLVLSKQRPDSSIHLLYNGGKGEVYVQNIMMKITLSNGQVVQQYMNDGNRKPRRGDELVIDGTRGTDFVQVYLTSAGRTYKVIEEPLVVSYLQ
jgi:hypothetical protein